MSMRVATFANQTAIIALLSLSSHVAYAQCPAGFTGSGCAQLDGASPPIAMRLAVDNGDKACTLNLVQYDARAHGLDVKILDANNDILTPSFDAAKRQYVGYCEQEHSSIVAATVLPNGSLRYRVSMGDGSADWGEVPLEETDPNAQEINYSIPVSAANFSAATAYNNSSFYTPTRGGLTADGKVYQSHLGFVLDKDYVDYFTNSDTGAMVRKAETSLAEMNVHLLRDVLTEAKLGSVLVNQYASAAYTDGRGLMDYAGMANTDNYVFTIGTSGGGLAPGCRNGGDTSNPENQQASQGYISADGSGTWYGILRHEYGHSLGSGHFAGGSPEGSTIMSGNQKSRFSGEELVEIELCNLNLGTTNFKAASNSYTDFDFIPPYARLDNKTVLDSNGTALIDVLANDHDANGDDIAIASFDATSALGASITFVEKGLDIRDKLQYQAVFPASIPDDCSLCGTAKLWLDASDADTIIADDGSTGAALTDSSLVSTWQDKSGSGNHAQIYNSPQYPKFKLSGEHTINGLPTVYFDDAMLEIRGLDLTSASASQMTSIAVLNQISEYPNTLWAQKTSSAGNKRYQSSKYGLLLRSKVFDAQDVTEITGSSYQVNYEQDYTSGQPGIGLGASMYAWEGYAGAYFSNMAVAEVLIFDRVLTDQEIREVELYLANKWMVPISDRFAYTIVDDTGRTNRGEVILPWMFHPEPDYSHFDGKQLKIENRLGCEGWVLCNWHFSWFSNEAYVASPTNTADLVPWYFELVPGTTNQFYISSNWGCPWYAKCGWSLKFNNQGELGIADITDNASKVPWEVTAIPGTVDEFVLRSKFQCDQGHVRCDSTVTLNNDLRVLLRSPHVRSLSPWRMSDF